ncbi:hypothetical protein NDR87_21990 [Nocardia sp. CDC159]|uniref:LGFP repeat-containing protein n=1 Tax=Nocardia pulmonis TaxID=2951408 RepID=A0A9X2EAK8_9NOCA|nr:MULTISPECIES: hypothetical protein [Nocardia]MCM6776809.1 hypothetical protein [Nocardia pulmonis]MCM6789042.1 hypothetical protein [Nocardia sp. CDC159]
MSLWKKTVSAAATGFALALGAGMLLSPPATAQTADADAAIKAHYQEKGGAASPLGESVGAPYAFGPDGAAQDYRGGKIVYSPDTGAKVMYGAILDKYLALGGADALGYPKNDESDSPVAGTARYSEFSAADGATIHWSPQNGAWLVRGPIRTAWSHLKASDGVMGSPISDTTVADGVYSQTFSGQNGAPVEIRWSQADGFATVPPDVAGQLSGLDVSVPGAAPGGVPAPPAEDRGSAAPATDNNSNAKWWALPIGLIIAAAAGGLAAMALRGRSGGSHTTTTSMPRHTGGAHLWRPSGANR